MEKEFEGRVAVVAAASSGLGRAIAARLAQGGASVAICSRDEARIAQAAEEIAAQTGASVWGRAVDLGDAEQIQQFIDEAARRFGRIDILVTNAGGPPAGSFEQVDDAAWEQAFQSVFMNVVRLIRSALGELKRNRGSIVNIASSSVRQPIPNLILSNAIRPAIMGLAKSLANELAPDGVRVNTVAPGRIDTERVRALDVGRAEKTGTTPEEVRRATEASIPLGRYGAPEEFAEVVAFLASERAAFITGSTIMVDGGMIQTL